MNGFYFIECDIDGRGKRWRFASVAEVASVDGSYFYCTFVDEGDLFQESLEVFRNNGSRIVGPFDVIDLLLCVQVADFVRGCEKGFLPQKKPGERPITAGTANGLLSAAASLGRLSHKHENRG